MARKGKKIPLSPRRIDISENCRKCYCKGLCYVPLSMVFECNRWDDTAIEFKSDTENIIRNRDDLWVCNWN